MPKSQYRQLDMADVFSAAAAGTVAVGSTLLGGVPAGLAATTIFFLAALCASAARVETRYFRPGVFALSLGVAALTTMIAGPMVMPQQDAPAAGAPAKPAP